MHRMAKCMMHMKSSLLEDGVRDYVLLGNGGCEFCL